jgi:hypothetical protein
MFPLAGRKLCPACQAHRDLTIRPPAERECACGVKFWPIRQKYVRCPDCSDPLAATQEHRPTCEQCGSRYKLAPGTTSCVACVQGSKQDRDEYKEMLEFRFQGIQKEKRK